MQMRNRHPQIHEKTTKLKIFTSSSRWGEVCSIKARKKSHFCCNSIKLICLVTVYIAWNKRLLLFFFPLLFSALFIGSVAIHYLSEASKWIRLTLLCFSLPIWSYILSGRKEGKSHHRRDHMGRIPTEKKLFSPLNEMNASKGINH